MKYPKFNNTSASIKDKIVVYHLLRSTISKSIRNQYQSQYEFVFYIRIVTTLLIIRNFDVKDLTLEDFMLDNWLLELESKYREEKGITKILSVNAP